LTTVDDGFLLVVLIEGKNMEIYWESGFAEFFMFKSSSIEME